MSDKVLYTARATVTGGRDVGHGKSDDGELEVDLRLPGAGGGTNPEQLFAVGYASCFENAVKVVARRMKIDADDISIDSTVNLHPTEERGFKLSVGLDVTLSSIEDPAQARELVAKGHEVCPYSNAVRGNIDVDITVNGEQI